MAEIRLPIAANFNVDGQRITNLADPIDGTDAANRQFVISHVSDNDNAAIRLNAQNRAEYNSVLDTDQEIRNVSEDLRVLTQTLNFNWNRVGLDERIADAGTIQGGNATALGRAQVYRIETYIDGTRDDGNPANTIIWGLIAVRGSAIPSGNAQITYLENNRITPRDILENTSAWQTANADASGPYDVSVLWRANSLPLLKYITQEASAGGYLDNYGLRTTVNENVTVQSGTGFHDLQIYSRATSDFSIPAEAVAYLSNTANHVRFVGDGGGSGTLNTETAPIISYNSDTQTLRINTENANRNRQGSYTIDGNSTLLALFPALEEIRTDVQLIQGSNVGVVDFDASTETITINGTNLSNSPDEENVRINSTTGDSTVIFGASVTRAGMMSASDKAKLNSIADGAEVNVQADWTEADSTADAFIRNKPTIGNGTITVTGGTALNNSAGNSFTLNQTANNTITINHDNISHTANTSTASPEYGQTFAAIDSINVNAQGHVIEYNTNTVTLPDQLMALNTLVQVDSGATVTTRQSNLSEGVNILEYAGGDANTFQPGDVIEMANEITGGALSIIAVVDDDQNGTNVDEVRIDITEIQGPTDNDSRDDIAAGTTIFLTRPTTREVSQLEITNFQYDLDTEGVSFVGVSFGDGENEISEWAEGNSQLDIPGSRLGLQDYVINAPSIGGARQILEVNADGDGLRFVDPRVSGDYYHRYSSSTTYSDGDQVSYVNQGHLGYYVVNDSTMLAGQPPRATNGDLNAGWQALQILPNNFHVDQGTRLLELRAGDDVVASADLDMVRLSPQGVLRQLNQNAGGTQRIDASLIPDLMIGDVYVYTADNATLTTFISLWGSGDDEDSEIAPAPSATSALSSGEIVHIIDSLTDIDTVYLYSGADVTFGGTLNSNNFHRINAVDGVTMVQAGDGLASTPAGGITTTGSIRLEHLGIEDLSDPNADRIMFWDDSAGNTEWLTAGSNLTISGTSLNAAAANLSATANGTSLTVSSSTGSDASIPAATQSAWGAMTDEDKTKLDGIDASADVNQNAYSRISVNNGGAELGTTTAGSPTDTFTLVGGADITLQVDSLTDTVTFNYGHHAATDSFHYSLTGTNLNQTDGSLQAVVLTVSSNSANYTFDISQINSQTGWTASSLTGTSDHTVTLTPDDSVVGPGRYTFQPVVRSTHTTDGTTETHRDHSITITVNAVDNRANLFYGWSRSRTISALSDLVGTDATTTGGVDSGSVRPSRIVTPWPDDSGGGWYLYFVLDDELSLPLASGITAGGQPSNLINGGTISGRNVYRTPFPVGRGDGTDYVIVFNYI